MHRRATTEQAPTVPRPRLPVAATACLLTAALAAGCEPALLEDAGEPPTGNFDGELHRQGGGKADGTGETCEYGVDFDESDPNDYLWTVKVVELWTLPVFAGSAEVHYRRFPAGVDPMEGDPARSGRIVSERVEFGPQSGELLAPTVIAEDISYDDLINGGFRFLTLRSSDQFAMTSCVQQVSVEDAVSSHNQILEAGPPRFDPTGFTDPYRYLDDEVRQQHGVVMLVEEDCDIPDPTNGQETRSVLSWLAVTLEAKPDPRLVDPYIQEGIDFSRGPDEGTYCQDSPYDWTWDINAYGAKTQVGNASDLPGRRSIRLDINGRFWQSGLEAENVQVDPENGDLNAQRGQIFTDFGGETVQTLDLAEILDDGGLDFRIRRSDWGSDLSYADCTATIALEDIQRVHESGDAELRLVRAGMESGDGAVEVVVEDEDCTDGWFHPLGLHYLNLGLELGDRTARHPEPPLPDLSEFEARPLRTVGPTSSNP